MGETLPVPTPPTPAKIGANTAEGRVFTHAKGVADVLDTEFTRLLSEVRAVDTRIQNSFLGRDSQSEYMGMVKLASTEPQAQKLNEKQVSFPYVESSKIQSLITDLDGMMGEAEYRKLQALLTNFIPQLFPIIFEHSRAIQLGLNYEDSEVQSGVDMYREGGELEQVRVNLRDSITEIDRGILREIIARMELFYHYTGVISPQQSLQLLPHMDNEGDEYMKIVFQAISNLCFQVRRSRGILLGASSWGSD